MGAARMAIGRGGGISRWSGPWNNYCYLNSMLLRGNKFGEHTLLGDCRGKFKGVRFEQGGYPPSSSRIQVDTQNAEVDGNCGGS